MPSSPPATTVTPSVSTLRTPHCGDAASANSTARRGTCAIVGVCTAAWGRARVCGTRRRSNTPTELPIHPSGAQQRAPPQTRRSASVRRHMAIAQTLAPMSMCATQGAAEPSATGAPVTNSHCVDGVRVAAERAVITHPVVGRRRAGPHLGRPIGQPRHDETVRLREARDLRALRVQAALDRLHCGGVCAAWRLRHVAGAPHTKAWQWRHLERRVWLLPAGLDGVA
eukprot:5974466-Prymnesium_polylepis.2